MYFKICKNPNNNSKCIHKIVYKKKCTYIIALKNNTLCKSCAQLNNFKTTKTKNKMRESHIGKNKGKNNGMYGKSIYSILLKKYGNKIANKKYNKMIEKQSKASKGKSKSNEHIEKNRQAQLKRFKDPKEREKISIKAKERFKNKKEIEKLSNSIKNLWKNVDYRQKVTNAHKNIPLSIHHKNKIRLGAIKRIEERKGTIWPNYNKDACRVINEYGRQHNYNFQHAENKKEYRIKKLGYWVDGYDKEKNVTIEYYEKRHYDVNGNLKQKELMREQEIIEHLNCKFIRINAFDNSNIKFEILQEK